MEVFFVDRSWTASPPSLKEWLSYLSLDQPGLLHTLRALRVPRW